MSLVKSLNEKYADLFESGDYHVSALHGGRLLDGQVAGFKTAHKHSSESEAKAHAEKLFNDHKAKYKKQGGKKKNFSVTVTKHGDASNNYNTHYLHVVDHDGTHSGASAKARMKSHHDQE